MGALEDLFGKLIYHDTELTPGLDSRTDRSPEALFPVYNDLELVRVPISDISITKYLVSYASFISPGEGVPWASVPWYTSSDRLVTELLWPMVGGNPPAGTSTTVGTPFIDEGYVTDVYGMTAFQHYSRYDDPDLWTGYTFADFVHAPSIQIQPTSDDILGVVVQRYHRIIPMEWDEEPHPPVWDPAFIVWNRTAGGPLDIVYTPPDYVASLVTPLGRWVDPNDNEGLSLYQSYGAARQAPSPYPAGTPSSEMWVGAYLSYLRKKATP